MITLPTRPHVTQISFCINNRIKILNITMMIFWILCYIIFWYYVAMTIFWNIIILCHYYKIVVRKIYFKVPPTHTNVNGFAVMLSWLHTIGNLFNAKYMCTCRLCVTNFLNYKNCAYFLYLPILVYYELFSFVPTVQ